MSDSNVFDLIRASDDGSPALSSTVWFTLIVEPRTFAESDWSAAESRRVKALLKKYILLALVSALCVALSSLLAFTIWKLHCKRRRRLEERAQRANRRDVNGKLMDCGPSAEVRKNLIILFNIIQITKIHEIGAQILLNTYYTVFQKSFIFKYLFIDYLMY